MVAAPRGERLPQGLRRFGLADLPLDDDHRRHRHRAGVVLEDERLGDLARRAVGGVVEIEALAVGEHAVADLEDLGVGLALGDGDRDRVKRPGALVGDALALEQRADRPQAVALARGVLEALLRRGHPHLELELALDLLVAAREERDHAVDRGAVALPVDVADARGLAALDVVVQARRAAAPPRGRAVAGAEHEHLAEHLERRAHALGVGVGAEVRAVAAVALAGEVDAGELLVERDRDVRIGLVVAQADVQARLVLLDEVLLDEQRLGLGMDDERLDLVDRRDHLAARPQMRSPPAPGEVRGDALADRLRLADVDDLALGVAEQVDAGLVGEVAATVGGEDRHPLRG